MGEKIVELNRDASMQRLTTYWKLNMLYKAFWSLIKQGAIVTVKMPSNLKHYLEQKFSAMFSSVYRVKYSKHKKTKKWKRKQRGAEHGPLETSHPVYAHEFFTLRVKQLLIRITGPPSRGVSSTEIWSPSTTVLLQSRLLHQLRDCIRKVTWPPCSSFVNP